MPSEYRLSPRSLSHLREVHPFLAAVPKVAIEITAVDFGIIDGARSRSEQRRNVDVGVSETMDSLHLVQADGFAWAFDAVPYVPGRGYVHVNESMEDAALWAGVEDAMWRAARKLGVSGIIEWGGNWAGFPDLAHWQLQRRLRRYILEG